MIDKFEMDKQHSCGLWNLGERREEYLRLGHGGVRRLGTEALRRPLAQSACVDERRCVWSACWTSSS